MDQLDFKPDHHARNTDPKTSHDAAHMNPGRRSGQRYKIAQAFFDAYPNGLNWDEAATIADVSSKSSPWRRVTELRERGLIEKQGTSKTSSNAEATKYVMTLEGLKALGGGK